MDLLEKMAIDLGFTYHIKEASHKGHFDKRSANWTGVMGHLVRQVRENVNGSIIKYKLSNIFLF